MFCLGNIVTVIMLQLNWFRNYWKIFKDKPIATNNKILVGLIDIANHFHFKGIHKLEMKA